jgi:hypothetical protein
MKKRDRIARYNELNSGYNITNIKKMSNQDIEAYAHGSAKSLDELYTSYSYAKRSSYRDILETYKPKEIHAVIGSNHAYSVLLTAENGDVLHITRSNNYLIDVTEV